jgi:hypothetical protein
LAGLPPSAANRYSLSNGLLLAYPLDFSSYWIGHLYHPIALFVTMKLSKLEFPGRIFTVSTISDLVEKYKVANSATESCSVQIRADLANE